MGLTIITSNSHPSGPYLTIFFWNKFFYHDQLPNALFLLSSFNTTTSPTEIFNAIFLAELAQWNFLSPIKYSFLHWLVNCNNECFCVLYRLVRLALILVISKWLSFGLSATLQWWDREGYITNSTNIILHKRRGHALMIDCNQCL